MTAIVILMSFSSPGLEQKALDIYEELTALFDWNPPPLHLVPDATQSKTSWKPAFYDKMLAEEFIL